MSWAKWDAEHRGMNVQLGKSATGGLRVTSGGKHLGNIEHKGGKHIAVIKKGGVLEHTEFASHAEALNHIRQAHGLGKGGGKADAEAEALIKQHSAPAAAQALTASNIGKEMAALGHPKWVKPKNTYSNGHLVQTAENSGYKAETMMGGKISVTFHGSSMKPGKVDEAKAHLESKGHKVVKVAPGVLTVSPGGDHASAAPSAPKPSSAQTLADQIRGALGPGTTPAPKTAESKAKKSASTVATAAGSKSTVVHGLGKPKSAALEKGKKYHSDSIKTKIHIAAWKAKKAAGAGGGVAPKAEDAAAAKAAKVEKIKSEMSDKAKELTKTAEKEHTAAAHKEAAAAHAAAHAAGAVPSSGSTNFHQHWAKYHTLEAAALDKKEQQHFELNVKATTASAKAKSTGSVADHRAAAEAHEAAAAAGAPYRGALGSHEAHAEYHRQAAKPTKKTTSAPVAAKKTSAPPPPVAQVTLPKQTGAYGGLSSLAYKATETANKSGSHEDHLAAKSAHELAAKSATNSHNFAMSAAHSLAVEQHGAIADKLKKVAPPAKKTSAAKLAATIAPSKVDLPPVSGITTGGLTEMAYMATERANKSGSYADHLEAEAMHKEASKSATYMTNHHMAEVHNQAAAQHRQAAENVKPGSVAKKTTKAADPASVKVVKIPEVDGPLPKLSKYASRVTEKANSEGTVAAHDHAATVHYQARSAAALAGNYDLAKAHHQAHEDHLQAIKAIKKEASQAKKAAAAPPAKKPVWEQASDDAYDKTAEAYDKGTAQAHEAAYSAHLVASNKATSAGANAAATSHLVQANKHLAEIKNLKNAPPKTPAELGSIAGKSRKAANAASIKANKTGALSDHQAAYDAHTKAYADAKAAGFDSWAKQHSDKAKTHYDLISKHTPAAPTHATSTAAAPKPVSYGALPSGGTSSSKLEEAADAAHEASLKAEANPTKANHEAAAEAHKAAYSASHYDTGAKASQYHHMMQSYHSAAASNPATLKKPTILKEHSDDMSKLFPPETHGLYVGFMDTASRRASQKAYDSVTKASASGLTPSERSSISAYTGTWYGSINNALRSGKPGGLTVKGHIKNLDAAFDKQPGIKSQIVTYRGISNPDTLFGDVGSHVGGEFQDKGYGSTASHAAVTHGFSSATSGGALIRIVHPAGSKLLKPSEVGNFNDNERELLIPRGTKFHVAADRLVTDQNGNTRRIIDLVRKE